MPPQQVQSLQHPPGNGTPILRLPVVIQSAYKLDKVLCSTEGLVRVSFGHHTEGVQIQAAVQAPHRWR